MEMGDDNVFMVVATRGLRSKLSGDGTLPKARRVWAKSPHKTRAAYLGESE